MRNSILIAALLIIVILTASYAVYADNGKKHLPSVCPQYNLILPCLATTLSENDVAALLAEGRRRWDNQLAAMRDDLNRYELWDEAERLWMITERSVRQLVGQAFPSQEEALSAAHYRLNGLIASGVSILQELLKRQRAS